MWGNDPSDKQINIAQRLTLFLYSNVQGGLDDIGNIDADPMFVDPDNDDYRLQPDSPCINTGNPAAIYNNVDGSRNDMGAYGGPKGNDWEYAWALSLDGDGDYIDILAALVEKEPNWTFSAWINPSPSGGNVYTEGNPLLTFAITIFSAGTVHVGAWNIEYEHPDSGNWASYQTPHDVISFGVWNFIAVTLENGKVGTETLKVYVNELVFSGILQQEAGNAKIAAIGLI